MNKILLTSLLLAVVQLSMAQKNVVLGQSEYHFANKSNFASYQIVHYQRKVSKGLSLWSQAVFTQDFSWGYLACGVGLEKSFSDLYSQTNIGLGYESGLKRPRLQMSQFFTYKNVSNYYSVGYGDSFYTVAYLLYKFNLKDANLKTGLMYQTDGTTGARFQYEFGPGKVCRPWLSLGYNFSAKDFGASFGLNFTSTF